MLVLAICDGARLTENAASCLLNSARLEAECRFSPFVTVLSGGECRFSPFVTVLSGGECRFSPFVTMLS